MKSVKDELRINKSGTTSKFNGKEWRIVCKIDGCTTFSLNKGWCRKHDETRKKNSTIYSNGDTKINKDGTTSIFKGKSWRTICKIGDCSKLVTNNRVCLEHGGIKKRNSVVYNKGELRINKSGTTSKFNGKEWKIRCKTNNCENGVIQGGLCIKHGAITPRCSVINCENGVQNKGLCFNHGAKVKKCKIKDCENQRQSEGLCFKHGAKAIKCSTNDCGKNAYKGGKCVEHGGGNRCPNCINWIDSRMGSKKYDSYCSTCFKRIFPNDKRSSKIYEKTKELKVRNFLNEKFKGFIHDKVLYTGDCDCTHRRRVDFRKLINNTLLCIEVDERQHSSYTKEDVRYNDLYMVYSGKWIFIRFNPDSYITDGKRVNPSLDKRLCVLEKEINKQISRIENTENTELLEISKLYFNQN